MLFSKNDCKSNFLKADFWRGKPAEKFPHFFFHYTLIEHNQPRRLPTCQKVKDIYMYFMAPLNTIGFCWGTEEDTNSAVCVFVSGTEAQIQSSSICMRISFSIEISKFSFIKLNDNYNLQDNLQDNIVLWIMVSRALAVQKMYGTYRIVTFQCFTRKVKGNARKAFPQYVKML